MGFYREYVDRVKKGIASQRAKLRKLKKQFESLSSSRGVFRIVVAGSFSCGKSAFINHILKSYVAAEGTKRETLCSTEYFFSEKKCWLAGGKPISEAEYKDRSTRENSTERFRVGLPSEFLKAGVSVVDTPGFDYDKNDNDNATGEIKGCDILFWLIKVNEVSKSDYDNLKAVIKAAKTKNGRKPLAVFLTQLDILKPDLEMTAREKLNNIRSDVREKLQKNKLDLVSPLLAVACQIEEDIDEELIELVNAQDADIAHIVDLCKSELGKSREKKLGALEKSCLELQRGMEQKCQDGIVYMTKQMDVLERRLIKASNEQERRFRKDLSVLVEKHFSDLAGTVFSNNPAIVSRKSADRFLGPPYTSEFHPSEAFLEAKTLYGEIGKLLARYSDGDGRPCHCEKAVCAVLYALKSSVHSVTCDSLWGGNEEQSRTILASILRHVLMYIAQDSAIIEACFLKFFEMPEVKWKSENIDDMRSDIEEIKDNLKRLRVLLGNCGPIQKSAKKPTGDSSQAKYAARQSFLRVLGAYQHMMNGGRNGQ